MGLFSTPIAGLRNLAASSAKFQELTGAVDQAAALAFVHEDVADDTADPIPRIIVFKEGFKLSKRSTSTWGLRTDFEIHLELATPDGVEHYSDAAHAAFVASMETIVTEWLDELRANPSSYPHVRDLESRTPPFAVDPRKTTTDDDEVGDGDPVTPRLWWCQILIVQIGGLGHE